MANITGKVKRLDGKKKVSPQGESFLNDLEEHKNDVVGRYKKRTGKGSSIAPVRPTVRGVMRNGKMVWIETGLGTAR